LSSKKKVYFCTPKIKYHDEENISAFKQKKKKQTWFPRKNGNREWPEDTEKKKVKRKKKNDCF